MGSHNPSLEDLSPFLEGGCCSVTPYHGLWKEHLHVYLGWKYSLQNYSVHNNILNNVSFMFLLIGVSVLWHNPNQGSVSMNYWENPFLSVWYCDSDTLLSLWWLQLIFRSYMCVCVTVSFVTKLCDSWHTPANLYGITEQWKCTLFLC